MPVPPPQTLTSPSEYECYHAAVNGNRASVQREVERGTSYRRDITARHERLSRYNSGGANLKDRETGARSWDDGLGHQRRC